MDRDPAGGLRNSKRDTRTDVTGSPRGLASNDATAADLEAIVHRIDRDIAKLLEDDFDHPDHDGLAVCARLSRNLVPAQPSGGRPPSSGIVFHGQYAALHVTPAFDGRDRRRLQRQTTYMLRPPCSIDAVSIIIDDERVRLDFKSSPTRAATHTIFSPRQLMARLAGLVPPPHFNLVRYRGVLSSRHHLRPKVAYDPIPKDPPCRQLELFDPELDHLRPAQTPDLPPLPTRISWARLLSRVFSIDVELCPQCQGKMKINAAVTDPDRIATMLRSYASLDSPDSSASQPGTRSHAPPHRCSQIPRTDARAPVSTLARPPPATFDAHGQRLLFAASA